MRTIHFIFAILLIIFCTYSTTSYAQHPDSISIADEDSLIFASLTTIELKSKSTVRFNSTASVYLNWSSPLSTASGFRIRYKLIGGSSWTSTTSSSFEKIVPNLQLDTVYLFEVSPSGMLDSSLYTGSSIISTRPQSEPITVSNELYNELTPWFYEDIQSISFCEHIDDISSSFHLYEILSFMQAYIFDNEAFSNGGVSTDFSDWYPNRFLRTLNNDICLPEFANLCQCKVVTNSSSIANPFETYFDGNFTPKIVQKVAKKKKRRTRIDRFEIGAAKYLALHQEDNVGMDYEMSNLQLGGDETAETTASSEIQFIFACLVRDEGTGGSSQLPEGCDCERPLTVSYEYETNLITRAEKGSCPYSRGASADAEDFAAVVVHNIKSGELTALNAGKVRIDRTCSSNWNPDWWITLLNLAETVTNYYVSTGGPAQIDPTTGQISDLFEDIETLIGTPFANQSGSCGVTELSQSLVSGSDILQLLPNRPLRISLFSSYYLRTRGYGCWQAAASIASDYYLLGVVESELTNDPECCTDKIASYILGSLSYNSPTPIVGNVVNVPVNSLSNRLFDVANDLFLYGDWNGYIPDPFIGLINLTSQAAKLVGPSCEIENPLMRPLVESNPAVANSNIQISFENISIEFEVYKEKIGTISLYDISGRQISTVYSGRFDLGMWHQDFPLSNLSAGSYILNCNFGDQIINFPIMLLK